MIETTGGQSVEFSAEPDTRASVLALVVSSPDQIFRARPADSSENTSGHFHCENWGKVYIWRAVNWVIVGVNYVISNQRCSSVCLVPRPHPRGEVGSGDETSLVPRLTQTQFTLPEQSDWCDNMTLCSYNYSKTSNNGSSEKRTTSLQRTAHLPPIDFTIHFEPPRSGHLSTPNNGH